MAFTGSARGIAVVAAFALPGMSGGAGAQMPVAQISGAAAVTLPHSPIPGRVNPAGLWGKPDEFCMTQCQELIHKDCFQRLMEKDPSAEAASIQDRCDEKYSLCLYDCMCENCKENQHIIWR